MRRRARRPAPLARARSAALRRAPPPGTAPSSNGSLRVPLIRLDDRLAPAARDSSTWRPDESRRRVRAPGWGRERAPSTGAIRASLEKSVGRRMAGTERIAASVDGDGEGFPSPGHVAEWLEALGVRRWVPGQTVRAPAAASLTSAAIGATVLAVRHVCHDRGGAARSPDRK